MSMGYHFYIIFLNSLCLIDSKQNSFQIGRKRGGNEGGGLFKGKSNKKIPCFFVKKVTNIFIVPQGTLIVPPSVK